ncbi:FAD dependent oxidoreductase [Amylocarpus encephaloides]|uniref:FAD dependent oxidoreductase n=1 Tax=Amylocarpus encephaloides TaxID=45428 RepID=A0A9P8C0S8_9HELO|nr:FAD dependent oxidoreductase [Amylocarpus encephaloides]
MGSIGPATILPAPLPVENATKSFWRTDPHELDEYRYHSVPRSCEVIIIGGGYAGIAAAYHLVAGLESVYDDEPIVDRNRPCVVLLEAREACSGATGRNGGHLRPSVYTRLPSLIEQYGLEAAVELCAFEDAHVPAIADIIHTEGIDCDFMLTRSFDIYTDREEAKKAKAAYDALKAAGVVKSTMDHLEWTDEEDAEKVSGVKGCVGCFTFPAAHLSPYKLFMDLLEVANNTGKLNIQTGTPALSIHENAINEPSGWTVETPRGNLHAKHVIVATNGYASHLLPEYVGKIVPCRGICSHITCPPGSAAPKMKMSYCLRLPNGSQDYLIPRQDGSIVVGGARSEFFHKREQWYNNPDDATLIEPAKHYFDNYMQTHFTGWEDSGAKVERLWTGVMGYTSDGLPSVGAVPDMENVWIAAGFEGHGMPVIWLTMNGIARMIKGAKFKESGIPRIYRTTRERLEEDRDDLAG